MNYKIRITPEIKEFMKYQRLSAGIDVMARIMRRKGACRKSWIQMILEDKQNPESTDAKDLREIEEMEVTKAKIDIASRLLEKQNQKEEAMRSSVTLGAEYKDKITGFKGVCTGYCEYISGCNQALLAPRVGKDGKPLAGEWYDVQRLEQTKAKSIYLDNGKTPVCDMAAPVR